MHKQIYLKCVHIALFHSFYLFHIGLHLSMRSYTDGESLARLHCLIILSRVSLTCADT